MSDTNKWAVKVTRADYERVVAMRDTPEAAQIAADQFNLYFETDEYYVEKWDN